MIRSQLRSSHSMSCLTRSAMAAKRTGLRTNTRRSPKLPDRLRARPWTKPEMTGIGIRLNSSSASASGVISAATTAAMITRIAKTASSMSHRSGLRPGRRSRCSRPAAWDAISHGPTPIAHATSSPNVACRNASAHHDSASSHLSPGSGSSFLRVRTTVAFARPDAAGEVVPDAVASGPRRVASRRLNRSLPSHLRSHSVSASPICVMVSPRSCCPMPWTKRMPSR